MCVADSNTNGVNEKKSKKKKSKREKPKPFFFSRLQFSQLLLDLSSILPRRDSYGKSVLLFLSISIWYIGFGSRLSIPISISPFVKLIRDYLINQGFSGNQMNRSEIRLCGFCMFYRFDMKVLNFWAHYLKGSFLRRKLVLDENEIKLCVFVYFTNLKFFVVKFLAFMLI